MEIHRLYKLETQAGRLCYVEQCLRPVPIHEARMGANYLRGFFIKDFAQIRIGPGRGGGGGNYNYGVRGPS
jgi:hypothetical protein